MTEQYFEEIEQLQKQIDELKAKINQENQPVKRWRAEINKKNYYYIDNFLNVETYLEQKTKVDNANHKIGNYFKTKQEAQDYLDNMLCKQELKDLALELNNGVEIDWENMEQCKYYIYYNTAMNRLEFTYPFRIQNLGQVYCLNPNFLKIAKERIGEDRLIKLIKSGV